MAVARTGVVTLDCAAPAELADFVEKPSIARAQELIIAGALWNTMVMCGTVDALWSLARTTKPHLIDVLDSLVPLIDTPDESKPSITLPITWAPGPFA